MSRWFRHYAGMMRDEKLVAVAVKAKQPVERVLWVWGAILESAAEINENGKYELDCDEVAYFLRADLADIQAIIEGLRVSARIDNGFVLKWSDRQYHSDTSAARQAAYRERKRQSMVAGDARKVTSDGGVTSRDGGVTAQDTDTDTDTDKKKDKAKALSKKGARLHPQWEPTNDDWMDALRLLGGSNLANSEFDKFHDYWKAVPGQKGVKLDWDATWRNWVRSAAERKAKGQSPPKQTYTDAANEIIAEMRNHERAKDTGNSGDVQFLSPASGGRETSPEYIPALSVRVVGRGGS